MFIGKPLKQVTLDSDVKEFIGTLPYWSQFVASKIYLNGDVTQDDLDFAYAHLLSDLLISHPTIKTPIKIDTESSANSEFKNHLLMNRLDGVEGVNALSENQIIEFSPNLTIIYGENGSGKSGYVRLLKKALHSKSAEDIEPNINVAGSSKKPAAKFTFTSGSDTLIKLYPKDGISPEFRQFSVFDGKCIVKHLAERNEFEFRPSGLGFFSAFSVAISKLETMLNADILTKNKNNIYVDLFEGGSAIKEFISLLSSSTDLNKLKEYALFTEKDVLLKKETDAKHDELFLLSRNKAVEIQSLNTIKELIQKNKLSIDNINARFSIERLEKINALIKDYNEKSKIAKAESANSFGTDKVVGVNTQQWRSFLQAASEFAALQHEGHVQYPESGDNCIFCQQELSPNAINLINSYWAFIKSEAEEQEKKAGNKLSQYRNDIEGLNFDVFPESHILTDWLIKNHPEKIETIRNHVASQNKFSIQIINAIETRENIDTTYIPKIICDYDEILNDVDVALQSLESDGILKQLADISSLKVTLLHKEKLSTHVHSISEYLEGLRWINKAKSADFAKAKITTIEKALSKKHFNNEYVQRFNSECELLNGDFGIEIDHTGAAGKSYRQLKIKGKKPNSILSEGEQKVIALADFMTEMSLSDINRGIVFDDPVTSLDEKRKLQIAKRLADEADKKQVIVFTHDLIFVSNLIGYCQDNKKDHVCHWIEKRDGQPGLVFLKNAPSYEREYRNSEPALRHFKEAEKSTCPPEMREFLLKQGFTALRTCYEVLVINELFCNVVQRYNERVSMESLPDVAFDKDVINEIMTNYGLCCRFMEGHTHSDKYAYKKPETSDLKEQIALYDLTKANIRARRKVLAKI